MGVLASVIKEEWPILFKTYGILSLQEYAGKEEL